MSPAHKDPSRSLSIQETGSCQYAMAQGHPPTKADWKQRKSNRSHTSAAVVVSQSHAYGSALTKLFWKQRKSKTPTAPTPVDWSQSGWGTLREHVLCGMSLCSCAMLTRFARACLGSSRALSRTTESASWVGGEQRIVATETKCDDNHASTAAWEVQRVYEWCCKARVSELLARSYRLLSCGKSRRLKSSWAIREKRRRPHGLRRFLLLSAIRARNHQH